MTLDEIKTRFCFFWNIYLNRLEQISIDDRYVSNMVCLIPTSNYDVATVGVNFLGFYGMVSGNST